MSLTAKQLAELSEQANKRLEKVAPERQHDALIDVAIPALMELTKSASEQTDDAAKTRLADLRKGANALPGVLAGQSDPVSTANIKALDLQFLLDNQPAAPKAKPEPKAP